MSSQQVTTDPGPTSAAIQRWYERMLLFVPWLLLVPPAVLSQLPTGQTWTDRGITLGLVAVAAAWVYAGHTRAALRRQPRPAGGDPGGDGPGSAMAGGPAGGASAFCLDPGRAWPMMLYFAGLLALFAALMSRDQVFVLFAISGFFHAYLLRPWPVGVAGVFGTSFVLNTMTIGRSLEPTFESWGTYLGVIAVQTTAIGAGIFFAEKSMAHENRREALVVKLEAALAENAGLHSQLLAQAREAGVLDERQRMAREIHDTLAQGLTGIITQVQAAQQVWHAPEQAGPYLDRALALARDSLAEARRSVEALRPPQLDDARLPEALSDLARRWAEGTEVSVRVEVTGDRVPLSPPIEVALFRVAQEALTNVAKHAGAGRVGLTLSYLDDMVLLDVRDDGKGMTGTNGNGFGLSSMRQRVRTVGGTVEIESAPGEGTAISACVPAITMGSGGTGGRRDSGDAADSGDLP